MIHPLYMDALKKINEEKTMQEQKENELYEEVELTVDEKNELNKILEDNYSRGAFMEMCFNVFMNQFHKNGKDMLGIDTVIKQALMTRLRIYDMAKKKDLVKNSYKGIDLVM